MRVTDSKFSAAFIAFAAGFVTLLIYLRSLSCGFVNFDDPLYVLNNPLIRHLDIEMLVRVFSEPHAGFWMPLTWISLAVDHHFWGLNPLGYHLTNIVMHAMNVGLVVMIADRVMQGAGGREKSQYPAMLFLAGLLWGIHPLRVESVVWVTERKDVLNGLFALSSVLAYMRFARQRDTGEAYLPSYLLAIALFACSLMAKSVSVVLPVILLVMDWCPLGRLKRWSLRSLFLEKTPFLLLSLVMAVMTVVLMKDSGKLVSYDVFPLGQRALVSGNAIFEYVRLMLYPVGVLPLYVFPNPLPTKFAITSAVAVLGVIGCFVVGRNRPRILVVMICFLLPLSPTLAFFQNGDQILAARFTYLPAVSVSLAAAFGCARFFCRPEGYRFKRLIFACAVALIVFYAGMSIHLIGYWKDTGTYWSRIIEIKPIGRAYSDRGRFYLESGDFSAAVSDLTRAAEIATQVGMPEVFNLYAFRGVALASLGRHEEALSDFNAAISLYQAPLYYYFRGLSHKALGNLPAAERDFALSGAESGPIGWYTLQ